MQKLAMDINSPKLCEIAILGDEIMPLVVEAQGEGHHFVRRLHDEWQSGENRFRGTGEFLLSAHIDGQLVGVAGLNRDPYSCADDVGRLRHLYVSSNARRRGIGALLVRRIIERAAPTFSSLRLRTTTAAAAAFYERLGFVITSEESATHIISLPPRGWPSDRS